MAGVNWLVAFAEIQSLTLGNLCRCSSATTFDDHILCQALLNGSRDTDSKPRLHEVQGEIETSSIIARPS